MTNKILLTGHDGFLGKIISKELSGQNHVVVNLSTPDNHRIDISTPFELDSNQQADIVVHAAGKAHSVPRTEKEADEFYAVNFNGTKNLCEALLKLNNKPKAFIFISTVAVYGLDNGTMITEKHPLNGATPYAKSKILAEHWLEKWCSENGITLGILRLPLIAGANPRGNLADMINGIKKGKYLSIGKAGAKKSIVWAPDIANIIPKIAEKGGTYNLTDGHHPSLGELENCIGQSLKKKIFNISPGIAKMLGYMGDVIGKRSPVNTDKIRKLTSTLTFDDSFAVKELGWTPTPILEKLASTI